MSTTHTPIKIEKVTVVMEFIIDMSDGGTYRRSAKSRTWEKMYGESWETQYVDDDLEQAYQDYLDAI